MCLRLNRSLRLCVAVMTCCLQLTHGQTLFSDVNSVLKNADSLKNRKYFRNIRDHTLDIIGRSTSSTKYLQSLQQANKLQPQLADDVPFPCPTAGTRSPERPTNVNRVRPGDIDFVAAMGDSLTAGNGAGATNILQVLTENRGVSWSIGGQGTWRQFLTLPNILKEFNPKLRGYSLGDSYSYHQESQFNVAEAGAMSADMPFMAKELVRRMRNDSRVNIDEDWKLITLLIGPNDFCIDMCFMLKPEIKVENHRENLHATLRTLRDNLPRTIVNVVMSPSISVLLKFTANPDLCNLMHVVECPCFFGLRFESQRHKFLSIIDRWQQVQSEVVQSPEYNVKKFAVVHQLFTKDLIFPNTQNQTTDFTYMSVDCFHFSQKGHARASNALWNNMLEPVGRKSTNWNDTFELFRCPSPESPYIFTTENSKLPKQP